MIQLRTAAFAVLGPVTMPPMNRFVNAFSADPLAPDLTQAVSSRESVMDLVSNFDNIRSEIRAALPTATRIQGDLFFESDVTSDGKWRKIYLKWYAPVSSHTQALFPVLTGILASHGDIRLAMVSNLEPGAVIHPHEGLWRGSIRVHIGIDTPNDPDCFIELDGTKYWWRDGAILAFDDTYEHRIENRTDTNRTILFLDVERKMKSLWAQKVLSFYNATIARLTARE